MEEIRFEVCHPDGRRERLVVPAVRATIGSGAHCDVRLSVDQASPEHVVVEVAPDGLKVQALAANPPAVLDGSPLTTRTVAQWGLIKIGDTEIRVARAQKDVAPAAKTPASTLLVRGACLLMLPVAVALILKGRHANEGEALPPLPDFALSTAPCPRTDPAEARAMADDKFLIAEASRERSPFSPNESLVAVEAYGIAAACYRSAHEEASATEAEASAKEVREATLLDARSRRLRLERMLKLGDDEIAQQDVLALTKLTEGQQGPFVTWLADVGQQLRRKGPVEK